MSAVITKASNDSLDQATGILDRGGLVAIPTETVYGLGCDATNSIAVANLYEAKGRPSFNPLITHVYDVNAAMQQGVFNVMALSLAEKFWPGPVTIVVPFKSTGTVCELARAGLQTIAIRVPEHEFTLSLLQRFAKPVVAPSANTSGRLSPTTAEHVFQDLGNSIDLIIDDGPCSKGIESTVVDCTSEIPRLLRLGAVPLNEIESHLGTLTLMEHEASSPSSPGQLLKHYAPRATLRLNADNPNPNEAFLGFGKTENATLNLSQDGNVKEAASNLFAMLRELDKTYDAIAVSPIPNVGLGATINDRLWRATN